MTSTTVATRGAYRIVKTERVTPYNGQTVFAIYPGADEHPAISVTVYHPEQWPGAPQPYTGARVNWPGTESTKLARAMGEALQLAAAEADQLNEYAAELWAREEIEDEGDYPARFALILGELTA